MGQRLHVSAVILNTLVLCYHAVKVLDFPGLTEVSKKNILKRWTRDARDVLPDHTHTR
uniref:Protein FAR1-RELATED SEQUENCE n=1 Tax=Aegilops tauschii subsp. strangulata TaxID=200361 RepID=A0A453ER73_AEGTS